MLQRLNVVFVIIGVFILSTTAAAVLAMGDSQQGRATSADDTAKLVGNWSGESICIGNHPACHDEKVVYHISKSPDKPGIVILAADKIIDGKPDPMYVLDFKYDNEKAMLAGEFSNSRYHGLWEYKVKGSTMEGTLSLLPERTIVRRIKVKKDE